MSTSDLKEQKAAQHERWNSAGPGYSKWVCETPFGPHVLYAKFACALVSAFGSPAAVRVLDVASASGEPALTLARALGPSSTVVSTDLAEAYVALGRARAERAGLGAQMSFRTADGEDLKEFADASFDAVTCSLGLMFMPSYPIALSEMLRVLRPGGTLALAVWQSLPRLPYFHVILELCHELDPEGVPLTAPNTACKFGDSGEELLRALQRAGFQDVKREDVAIEFTLPAGSWWEALVELPLQLSKTLAKLREEGQVNICEDAKEQLAQKFRERGFLRLDGSVSMPGNHCNFITATK